MKGIMAAIKHDVIRWFRSEPKKSILLLASLILCFLLVPILYNNFKPGGLRCEQFVGRLTADAVLPARQVVLLVTYGRSGSTFTSALIKQHKDVFLIYEPLFPLNLALTNSDRQNESTAIINSFMVCDLPPEHVFALNNHQFYYREDTRGIYKCLASRNHGLHHVACYVKFLKDCRSHRTLFIKTIRFRVKWAETFLQDNQHFKLLYLVRDPRATLFSQAQAIGNFRWPAEVFRASQNHCAVVKDDLQEIVRLANLYPGRVKGIRYECGATDPFSYTRDIYNFLGLQYNTEVASFVEKITTASAGAPDVDRDFGFLRNNSTLTMNKWRQYADFESIRRIDAVCGFMYSKLGYKFVQSPADLRSTRTLVSSPDLHILSHQEAIGC